MMVSFRSIEKMNHRLVLFLGGIINASAIYFSSYLHNFNWFIIVFSGIGGIGFGLIYQLPLKCAWSYFPK